MEDIIEEIQIVELFEEMDDDMGPAEREEDFGVPAEDIELEEV